MEDKKIYSHFIQKSYAKKWANDHGEISYIIHGTNEGGKFNISSRAINHPIAEFGFFDDYIEKGMNLLESKGIDVVNKIIQSDQKIVITRQESDILRYFFILNAFRTNLARENITNLNGDRSFNEMMKRENGTPKDIQQKEINILIDSFERYIKTGNGKFPEEETNELIIKKGIKEGKSTNEIVKEISVQNTAEKSIKMEINTMNNSRLVFVDFQEGDLLLTETAAFQEISHFKGSSPIYNCFILSPNKAVIILKEHWAANVLNLPQEQSIIFKFDLSKRNDAKYTKQFEMELALKAFIKKHNNMSFEKVEELFCLHEMAKFLTLSDKFIYDWNVVGEWEAWFCNAMMLVHCNDSYVIFKNINTYYNSIEMQKAMGIFRIEDLNK